MHDPQFISRYRIGDKLYDCHASNFFFNLLTSCNHSCLLVVISTLTVGLSIPASSTLDIVYMIDMSDRCIVTYTLEQRVLLRDSC